MSPLIYKVGINTFMKKTFFAILTIFVIGCNSDKGFNCFQAAGDIVQNEVSLAPFNKIIVWERVKLFVKEGPEQKVVVESGENLMNDIELTVEEGKLAIHNNNGCNIVRDYGITKVYVTSPNITEIRSSTGLTTESIGVLRFPSLLLLSEDQANDGEFHTDGDFNLNLEVNNLEIVANGLSTFYLTGSANTASFGLYAGDGRIFAENFEVQNLNIYHRSTADMRVHPVQAIRGSIVSIGDVYSVTHPPIVDVEELYRGRLIFE